MTSSEESTFDKRRRLCSDGSCVGLIGDNNFCKVCGMPADGNHEAVSDAAAAVTTWDGTEGETAESDDALLPGTLGEVAQLDDAEGPGAFNPSRRLCSDGSCVGVIGADGRCGVCGQPGE